MKFTTITKWEFKDTLSSRKSVMIFILQLSILLLMIVVFNSFVANMESEQGLSIAPSLSGFASVNVQDSSGLFQKRINTQVLDVTSSNYNSSLKKMQQGQSTGFLQVPDDTVNDIRTMKPVNLVLYVDYTDPKRSLVENEVNSTAKTMQDAISASWVGSLNPQNDSEPEFSQKSAGGAMPAQVMDRVMLAILLFLPLFLFGNMLVDSIVGEKERKTGEILIAMPISQAQVVLGKGMAVVLTIAIQVALWILILLIAGFQIKNLFLVYALVVLTSLPVVGITSAVSAYAKNYKEAGIVLSFIYIGIVGFLIIPAVAYVARKSMAANISSMTLVMRLLSGEPVAPVDYLPAILCIVIVGLLSYWIAVKLFQREDVSFGPRPGILKLLKDLVSLKF
jgi:ABC-2 type transport system permease protein